MSLRNIFIVAVLLSSISIIFLQIIGSQLITDVSPLGIVSFEFAGDLNQAHLILNSWGVQGKLYAGIDLGIDYLFILVYSITLICGSLLVTKKSSNKSGYLKYFGLAMAILSIIAGLFDCVENYALIKVLLGNGSDELANLAYCLASLKFIFVGVIIFYILSMWTFNKFLVVKSIGTAVP